MSSKNRDIATILGRTEEENDANTRLTVAGEAAGLDSALAIDLIDSDYVSDRTPSSAPANYFSNGTGGATGTSFALAIGTSAYAGGTSSTALSNNADVASGATGGVAIGVNSNVDANSGVAVGNSASAQTQYGIAIGNGAVANGGTTGPIAIGYFSDAISNGVAIGPGFSTTARAYAGNTASAYGYQANASGSYSTAIGGFSDGTSTRANALGYNAQATNSYTLAAGPDCTASGQYGTALGYAATASGYNATAIGNGASSTVSNRFVLGNTAISDLRCQDTSISSVSDSRDKTQVQDLTIGLAFVNAINPKSFYKNNRSQYYTPTYTPQELLEDSDLVQTYTFDSASYNSATMKYDKKEFGFVSQDIAAQLPAAYSDARVSFNETDDTHGFDVQHFTMGDMTPILWKAVKELSAKYDQLDSDYTALQARVAALENA